MMYGIMRSFGQTSPLEMVLEHSLDVPITRFHAVDDFVGVRLEEVSSRENFKNLARWANDMPVCIATVMFSIWYPYEPIVEELRRRVRNIKHEIRAGDDEAIILIQQSVSLQHLTQENPEKEDNAARSRVIGFALDASHPLWPDHGTFAPPRMQVRHELLKSVAPIFMLGARPDVTSMIVEWISIVFTLVFSNAKCKVGFKDVQKVLLEAWKRFLMTARFTQYDYERCSSH